MMTKNQLYESITKLKEEKNAIILAHYYTEEDVQEISDYVGDSYYLSKMAMSKPCEVIVFCGVAFMGESAQILNLDKVVIMPDLTADCPMAHMADCQKIQQMREEYEDLAVVCYINSSAEIKASSDVCVTSSNAVKIVQALPHKYIYFIPDQNLGRYVAEQVSDKHFIFNEGHCPIHTDIKVGEINELKACYQQAKILVHPECSKVIVEMADYVGSTLGIIEYAKQSEEEVFIVCTEQGILYALQKECPGKQFLFPKTVPICPDMKKVTLVKIKEALERLENRVEIPSHLVSPAKAALCKMHELGQ